MRDFDRYLCGNSGSIDEDHKKHIRIMTEARKVCKTLLDKTKKQYLGLKSNKHLLTVALFITQTVVSLETGFTNKFFFKKLNRF